MFNRICSSPCAFHKLEPIPAPPRPPSRCTIQPVAALAQNAIVGTAALPRDLTPWGMFMNADEVVKAVLIGLAFASVVTWTVWLAKTVEIVFAKRRVRTALNVFANVRSISEGIEQPADAASEVRKLLDAAERS